MSQSQKAPYINVPETMVRGPPVSSRSTLVVLKKIHKKSIIQMNCTHARLSRSGSGFDPWSGQVSWVRFFRGFSSPVRQIREALGPHGPRISFGHHYHPYSFITGANDLRCWSALKHQIYIHMNCVSHFSWKSQILEMTHGNRLSLFLPLLTFYEICCSSQVSTSQSILINKRGI